MNDRFFGIKLAGACLCLALSAAGIGMNGAVIAGEPESDRPAPAEPAGKKKTARSPGEADSKEATSKPAPPETVTLDPVRVTAEAPETSWGPVKGYVARESATATKTDTPLIETPQSVSVITRDRMEAQQGQFIETLLGYTAGVRGQAFGFGSHYTGFLIRGYQPTFFQLFRDGLVQYGQMQPEPYGLERIEVLRGPASVMYGEGNPGGLVNMVTKRPLAFPANQIEMNGGSFDWVQGMADLSGPLDDAGEWSYRFTTKNRGANTQMDFVPDDRLFFAPALTWQPSADTSVTFLTNFQQDTSKFATLAPAHGTLLPNPNGEIPTSRFLGTPDFDNLLLTSYQLGYLLQHKFTDDLIFRQNVRYHDVDRDFRFTYGFGDLLDNFTTWERESITSRQRVGIFALDNQLQYRWDMDRVKQTLLAGINYNDLTDDFRGGFHAVAPINIFNPVYGLPDPVATPFADDAQTLSQLGLYFQDQIKIDDRLVIMGGGRQDFVDSRFTRTDFYTPGQPRTTETQSPQAFTGRAGLLYLFDSGIAPYFSYSTSFSPVPGADRERRPFQPETAENYEVGIKYEPIDWKGLFTLALFDTLREGALIPDPDDPLFMVQLGQVRTQGAEVEGVVTLAEGLNLIANYTYLDPRNLHPRDPAQGPIPPAVPRNMGSIWAEYRVPSGDFAGLGVAAGMRHMGSTLDWTNDLTIPANTVMDAMLSYQVDRWRFSVNANNILDETFVAWCGGLDACAFGARRFILGSVRYSW